MSLETLPCVELEPKEPARASVIWLHGLGADGHDFEPVVPMLGLAEDAAVRFVFPHAPSMPVTVNGGMVMPAWYDIQGLDFDRRADVEGVERSAEQLRALVARENQRGIPPQRTFLAGFSQGGAIAMHVALRFPERLAGLIALSTYLAVPVEAQELGGCATELPVFMGHGSLDPMVALPMGTAARDRLQALGLTVAWHEYPMAHQVCAEEIEALGAWLSERLG